MNGALPQKTEILPVAGDEKERCRLHLTERGGVFAFSEFSDGCVQPLNMAVEPLTMCYPGLRCAPSRRRP
jgi:hypothetical protein